MSDTPVWQVDGWTLEEGLAKIDQQWSAIREVLEDPDLYALRAPEVAAWSCGEHAGHLAKVMHWVASGIEANLAEPDRDADGAWGEHAGPVLEAGDFPRGVVKAPPAVDAGGHPREEFLPVLPAAIEAWKRVAARAAELPGCRARFEHFVLGYLTSTEWVRFCAIHSAHHLAIVRDIREVAR